MELHHDHPTQIYVNKATIDRNKQRPDDMMPPLVLVYPDGRQRAFWQFEVNGLKIVYDYRRKEGLSTCIMVYEGAVIDCQETKPTEAELEALMPLKKL